MDGDILDQPSASALLGDVQAALARGDFERANALSRQGLIAGTEAPLLLNVAAFGLEREGRLDDALRLLERAHALAPGDAMTLSSMGHWHLKTGRTEQARVLFDAALALDPASSSAHHGRGLALVELKDFPGAWTSQEAARALSPDNPEILGALASLSLNFGRLEAARAFAEDALRLDPASSSASVALGALDFKARRFDDVVARMRTLVAQGGLSGLHAASAWQLLADALDALGRYREAFDAYERANQTLRAVHASLFALADVERGPELCQRLCRNFRGSDPAAWRAPSPDETQAAPAAGHVFLVGFPRSGTTLLEQVLATHEAVVALEEKPTLGDVGIDFFGPETIHALAAMTRETADDLRRRYWSAVRGFDVEPAGRVFVDKLPLNALWLPYVQKLFPKAKILFAKRDPRDVVLSCFRRRFRINGAMFDLTDLHEAARFYAGFMELAGVYRQVLDLRWYDHRHEDLVDDFEGETRALCDFLDLPWTETLREFAETAKRRNVQTPSASQVRRGLYREGMGQWRGYADALAPVLPLLEPWVRSFAYPPA